MNPLCTLRYSATHVDKHHMVYRLDAVDAYERELVKQIEVASLEVGKKIRSGAVNINGAVMSSYASGGGVRMSGLGRERGIEGLREFQMQTTFNIGG